MEEEYVYSFKAVHLVKIARLQQGEWAQHVVKEVVKDIFITDNVGKRIWRIPIAR